ncbi:hypothetical protein EYF80_027094 [Liparis tanakae]|uniref:Uncharacterized protein n=1 Tax=Liparis tanakae TaxID=230148 RepID=A0A4Z2HCB8_9TELE|nr:hypothetical protein EYF80_027094 [Liparis tanakae]
MIEFKKCFMIGLQAEDQLAGLHVEEAQLPVCEGCDQVGRLTGHQVHRGRNSELLDTERYIYVKYEMKANIKKRQKNVKALLLSSLNTARAGDVVLASHSLTVPSAEQERRRWCALLYTKPQTESVCPHSAPRSIDGSGSGDTRRPESVPVPHLERVILRGRDQDGLHGVKGQSANPIKMAPQVSPASSPRPSSLSMASSAPIMNDFPEVGGKLASMSCSLDRFGPVERVRLIHDSPQSVPSPLPLDSGEVSISSGLDRKSKPFSASSVSGSSLVSILAGVVDDVGFFLRIWREHSGPFINSTETNSTRLCERADDDYFLTVLDSTLARSLPSLSSSSSSSLKSAAAFSMNLKASSTALLSESSAFLRSSNGGEITSDYKKAQYQ